LVLVVGILTDLDLLEYCNSFDSTSSNILSRGTQKLVEETMKGLTGFIVAIFLISLSAGLMYYHCNATKMDESNEVPDSTMTFDPADTTAASQDNWEMYKMVLILEQIQNS
jgi:hypothetical protein